MDSTTAETIIGSGDFNLYNDVKTRTNGEIYIGVVGPVRTGKSTFIKRFMDLMVIPGITDKNVKERTVDELPQSAAGRTIMTTEPKFIPKEAALIKLNDEISVKFRLIDCVGFMVEGATGHIEDEKERPVKTPWFDYAIPFSEAAEIGTKKVICDHSTIGIVITSDGSFGELDREVYLPAEERTIKELKLLNKPFIVLLNSQKPYSDEVRKMALSMEEKYDVTVLPVSCEQLRRDDIKRILEAVLLEFPISEIAFKMPGWVDMLTTSHQVKKSIISNVKQILSSLHDMKDIKNILYEPDETSIVKRCKTDKISMDSGCIELFLETDDTCYYNILSELLGIEIEDEYELLTSMKTLVESKSRFRKFENAYDEVISKGYGVVNPEESEITLEEPELIRHGNKFGVKIKANAPSIHMISASIETEIAPIVGTEDQANDLINYIKEGTDSSAAANIREALIFGKSIGTMIGEGIEGKIGRMTDECQQKMQETLQKIINESSAGVVFIFI